MCIQTICPYFRFFVSHSLCNFSLLLFSLSFYFLFSFWFTFSFYIYIILYLGFFPFPSIFLHRFLFSIYLFLFIFLFRIYYFLFFTPYSFALSVFLTYLPLSLSSCLSIFPLSLSLPTVCLQILFNLSFCFFLLPFPLTTFYYFFICIIFYLHFSSIYLSLCLSSPTLPYFSVCISFVNIYYLSFCFPLLKAPLPQSFLLLLFFYMFYTFVSSASNFTLSHFCFPVLYHYLPPLALFISLLSRFCFFLWFSLFCIFIIPCRSLFTFLMSVSACYNFFSISLAPPFLSPNFFYFSLFVSNISLCHLQAYLYKVTKNPVTATTEEQRNRISNLFSFPTF